MGMGDTMESRVKLIKTNDEFKIISDPYRMKILDIMIQNGNPMTVTMIADELGEVPAKVHYHVKKFLSLDILKLEHTELINGITAKYYIVYYSQFKIDVDDMSNDNMQQIQIDNVTKLVVDKINQFKEDFVHRTEDIKNLPKDQRKTDGMISKTDLYLNDEELKEFRAYINRFTKQHATKNDAKKKYSTFIGLIQKNNQNKNVQ